MSFAVARLWGHTRQFPGSSAREELMRWFMSLLLQA